MNPRRKGYGAGENQNSAWMDGVRKDLNNRGLILEQAKMIVHDKAKWKVTK